MRRFSRPVRYASTAAYCPERPISRRTARASVTTSKPATRARPASGASSVARIRTMVVLPAPFGPSSASTLPAGSSRSTPSSARTSPKRLPRPSARIAGCPRAGKLLAACGEQFARVGLERANVDAISLAAGYAKGTIYNYFPSKEELFLAVVEEAAAQATASGATPANAAARERLAAILAGFCAWAGNNDPLARVLVRECL